MRKCKLSECVKEINDRTTENNQYEVLTSSKNGIFSQEEYFDKQVASKDNTGYKIIKNGQFTYRSMSDSGTFTINRLEDKEIGIVSPAYPVFEATNIDAEFLKYYFRSELFNKAIINLSQGSTRTALKFKDLIDIEIYLPEIEEQKRIVKILKNNDQIIERYEKLIKEKEQFIKSQFVEMFERGQYQKDEFTNIVKEIYAGGDKPKDISKIQEGEYLYPVFANGYENEGLQGYSKGYRTGDNAVTVSARGTIGYSYIRNEKFTPIVRLITIIPNEKANVVYLKYAIDNLNIAGSGTSQAQLTVPDIKKKKITIPPIELQYRFADFVKLIDKQKFICKKSIKYLKKLLYFNYIRRIER